METADLATVVGRLRIREAADILAEDWELAAASMTAGDLPFLDSDYVHRACRETCLTDEMAAPVLSAAKRVAADGALRALAWYFHYRLFLCSSKPGAGRWPLLTEALGPDAGGFNTLLLLSGMEQMRATHRRRGIPADVVRDTVLDLRLCTETEDYTRDHDVYGISPRILGWLILHWRGELYRLGRLQFLIARSHARLRAFRHRETGVVVALSEPGIIYRADGQVDGAGGVYDPEGSWVSALQRTADENVGHPIHPTGYAVREPVHLRAADWTQVLAPEDPVLDMHIAAGEPMDFDRCGESIARALEFFPAHFPEHRFVAFTCSSWILDHQFESLLPPASNLVRFQQEVYLFPLGGGGEGVTVTVFGRKPGERDDLPQETTMQRAFAQHWRRGGHFRSAGCFLMVEDFDWGSRVYRRQELLPQ